MPSTAAILVIDGDGWVLKTNSRFAELWQIPGSLLQSDLNNVDDLQELLRDRLAENRNTRFGSLDLRRVCESKSREKIQLKDERVFEQLRRPLHLANGARATLWSFRAIDLAAENSGLNASMHRRGQTVSFDGGGHRANQAFTGKAFHKKHAEILKMFATGRLATVIYDEIALLYKRFIRECAARCSSWRTASSSMVAPPACQRLLVRPCTVGIGSIKHIHPLVNTHRSATTDTLLH